MAGWEAAVLGWFGAGAPAGPGLWLAAGLFATGGAVLGAVAGGSGLSGGSWSLAVALGALGVLASGKLGALFSLAGIPGALGVAFCIGAFLAAAQLAARLPIPPRVQIAMAGTLCAWVAICVPLNLNLLPASASALALTVDLIVLAFAGLVGMLAAISTPAGRVPMAAVLVAGAVGWGSAWPVLQPDRSWPRAEGDGQPLVLIVIDGLRADRIGSGGYDRNTTPQLDGFARRAVRFQRATSTSPWTIPALGSLLTGQLPYGHGAGLNDGGQQLHTALGADSTPLAFLLDRQGYLNVASVGDLWLDSYGMDQGFAEWRDTGDWGALSASVHPFAVSGLGTFGWPTRRTATRVVDDAVAFLDTQEGGGWFLTVQLSDLEALDVTEEAMAVLGRTSQPPVSDAYDATLRSLDTELGRLFDAIPDDAWVVVVGDHGTQLTEQRAREPGVPVGVRSGHGMHQELLRVPLLVRVPGRSGRGVGRPVSTVDLMPTLAEVLAVKDPRERDGVPLPEITGRGRVEAGRPLISQCVQYGPEQQAVRKGDHKLVRMASGRTPMYDLAGDPNEVHPLPSGGRNDQLEKDLGAALPPTGAGAAHGRRGSLSLDLGAFASRLVR